MKSLIFTLFQIAVVGQLLAITPDRVYHLSPDSLGLTYESHIIQTSDDAGVKLWDIKAQKELDNGNTIILCYGDSGNMSYWLNHAAILSQVGYSVVLFDYRGFGESSDFVINPNQLYYDEFSMDLEAVIRWTKQNLSYANLGILSFSMGTIMTTIAVQNESVDFIVAEGFVMNPENIKEKIFQLKGKEIILLESAKGFEALISKIDIPLLLISGTEDVVTTLADSQEIVAQKVNRKLISFEGNHLGGFQKMTKQYFGDIYIQHIGSFIEAYKQ